MVQEWCGCKGHNTRDFVRTTDFYCKHFIPSGWALDYGSLDTTEDKERTLWIVGRCSVCGGFMRTGTSIPINISGDRLIDYVAEAMRRHYRPFDYKRPDGDYHGAVSERARWYKRQDTMPPEQFARQFHDLFHEKDHVAVQEWLKNHSL
jgi:hypothetical protein